MAALAYGLWWLVGWLGLAVIAVGVTTFVVVAACAQDRGGLCTGVVVTHRVRVGLVQAGVANPQRQTAAAPNGSVRVWTTT